MRESNFLFPRLLLTFNDGGAFPEIHAVAQYPRHMGNPRVKHTSSGMAPTVAGKQAERIDGTIKIDASAGEVSFDAIVKGGTNADKTVFTKYSDLRGEVLLFQRLLHHCLRKQKRRRNVVQLERHTVHSIVRQQTALDKPSDSAMANAATSHNHQELMQFIKYKPQPDVPGYNPAAAAAARTSLLFQWFRLKSIPCMSPPMH
jgi:hypothetical protein